MWEIIRDVFLLGVALGAGFSSASCAVYWLFIGRKDKGGE